MKSALFLAVENGDMDFVREFVHKRGVIGDTNRRQALFVAGLLDKPEVARIVVNEQPVWDYYTIVTALSSGSLKVADVLSEGVDLNLKMKPEAVEFFVGNYWDKQSRKVEGLKWLGRKGYNFTLDSLVESIRLDNWELFQIMVQYTSSPVSSYLVHCLQCRAFKILEVLETKGLVEHTLVDCVPGYREWKLKREKSALKLQMEWQNYKRRVDPSIALKEAEKSWEKLIREFPHRFLNMKEFYRV